MSFTFFYIFPALLSLTFSLLLSSKKGKTISTYFLSAVFILLTIQLGFATFKSLIVQGQSVLLFDAGFMIAFPLFVFLYTKSIISKMNISAGLLLHGVPVLLLYVFICGFGAVLTETSSSIEYTIVLNSILMWGLGWNLYYLNKTRIVIKEYNADVLNIHSNLTDKNLRWIQHFLISYVFVFVAVFSLGVALNVSGISVRETNSAIYVFLSLFVIYLGYYGFKQGILYEKHLPSVIKEKKVECDNKREFDQEIALLSELMKNEKPYLDPALSIYDLAKQTRISTQQLSHIINKHLECNFYEYVNKYRIEEFKARANSNPEHKIIGLAYDAGFNSKATFNRIFKKIESITPSEYLKSVKRN